MKCTKTDEIYTVKRREAKRQMYTEELISVIVPVYNVKNYINRCVDSIIYQTYKNLEIILVDDGSTDGSGSLCDRYEQIDSRIKVIHKENGGLSDARNTGLDIAVGEYITFVDSDDWLRIDYVELLLEAIRYGKTKISACAYLKTKKLTEQYEYRQISDISKYIESWQIYDAYQHLFLNNKIDSSAWAKLYERSLFEDIEFPVGKLYEDQFVTYKLFHLSQAVTYVDQKMYFYFDRTESIQNQVFTIKKMDELAANLECMIFINEFYPRLNEAVTCKLISSCFHMLFAIDDLEKWKSEKERLEGIIKMYRKNMIIGKAVNKKVRLGCLCTYFGFGVAKRIYIGSGVRGKINI